MSACFVKNRQTDGYTDGQTDTQTDRQRHIRLERHTYILGLARNCTVRRRNKINNTR